MKLPVQKLDRSRPFGQVCGEIAHNIAFTQRALGLEAWPYDASGDLIEAALNEKQKAALQARRDRAAAEVTKPKAEPTPEEIAAEEERNAKLAEGETDGADGSAEDEINLVMWLRGEVKYRPTEVQEAIKKRYGVNKPKMRDAAQYLVEEQNLLPRDEVSTNILPAQK